jgi:hypothetical protein
VKNALRSTIHLGRNALVQRRYLRNSHTLSPLKTPDRLNNKAYLPDNQAKIA